MKRKKLFFIIPAAMVGIVLFMPGVVTNLGSINGGVSGRGWHRSSYSGRRMGGRWASMTSEEREKFRQGMRERCGFGPPTSEGQR